ncbi:hypothetical protein [Lacipirellula parvula]|uniref:Uncharacterized protein n=1 Tax=Lacipirellula parvula TaxID=2650471 RepID=A0A5K7XG50_9BACT|nr:hypothetical protein [Lacipirellula parvula]BBO33861.1 hypothetical protein PLANPX_3473 [Lacipirellula parvula]
MRRVRPLALTLSLAVACAAAVGCSPDRQSGMNKKPEPAAADADAESSEPQSTADSAVSSDSTPPPAATGVSGFQMPDSKSMLITDEAMTSSLSAPVADPIAPHGQPMQQTPLIPTMVK